MDEIARAFERIKARVEVERGGCWMWLGSQTTGGYGQIKVGGKVMATHRVAYMAVHGPIPRGKVIRHSCDNPACCNPDHVGIGDHEDNTQDIRDRGNARPRRILTAEEHRQAVEMRRAGATKRQIAETLKCNWYAVMRALDASGVDRRVGGRPRGSRNANQRITEAAKREIRDLYAAGQHTQAQLAERFGCDQTYISLIVRDKV